MMKRLLHIDSSPRRERSDSRQLTAHFARCWQETNPGGVVIRRDLGLRPPPFVNEAWIAAAFSRPADRTPEQRDAIAVSDELIDELLAADEIVIGAPMYNFAVSAALKAWIDQIVRVGRTVETPTFAGLVRGKRVVLIVARGLDGLAPGEFMAGADAQVPYLRQILAFIGITDVSVVYAGHLTGPEEARRRNLERARREVEALAWRSEPESRTFVEQRQGQRLGAPFASADERDRSDRADDHLQPLG